MEDPIKYYKSQFIDDYTNIQAEGYFGHVSLRSFSPEEYEELKEHKRNNQLNSFRNFLSKYYILTQTEIFQSFSSKHLFLFCYFFYVLFDQAVHSAIREEHKHFERLTNYLKLGGILSTSGVNFHPGHLILMATLYMDEEDKLKAKPQFKRLADYFLEDYESFLLHKYPEATGRLIHFKSRKEALIKILKKMNDATKASGRYDMAINLFTSHIPDNRLYSKLMDILSTKTDNKLLETWLLPAFTKGPSDKFP